MTDKIKYYTGLYFETLKEKNQKESKSQFVGNIGEKITIIADVTMYNSEPGNFNNIQHVCKLIDDDGNKYMTYNIGKPVNKGDTLKLTAKVKKHEERLGIKFTILYFCKILSTLSNEISKFNL